LLLVGEKMLKRTAGLGFLELQLQSLVLLAQAAQLGAFTFGIGILQLFAQLFPLLSVIWAPALKDRGVEWLPSVLSSPWAGATIDNVTNIRHNGPLRMATPEFQSSIGQVVGRQTRIMSD
jgi:hypothetical protein